MEHTSGVGPSQPASVQSSRGEAVPSASLLSLSGVTKSYGLTPVVHGDEHWDGGFGVYTDETDDVLIFSMFEESAVFLNKTLVPEYDDSYQFLLDPALKGQILIENPVERNGGSMATAVLLDRFGEDFVMQLLEQDLVPIEPELGLERVADGRAAVMLGAEREMFAQLADVGLADDIVTPEFAALPNAWTVTVLTNAPHPNATKVFLNYFLSAQGQRDWVELGGTIAGTRRLDVENTSEFILPYDEWENYPLLIGVKSDNELIQEAIDLLTETGRF